MVIRPRAERAGENPILHPLLGPGATNNVFTSLEEQNSTIKDSSSSSAAMIMTSSRGPSRFSRRSATKATGKTVTHTMKEYVQDDHAKTPGGAWTPGTHTPVLTVCT